jgi:hypothetical protein
MKKAVSKQIILLSVYLVLFISMSSVSASDVKEQDLVIKTSDITSTVKFFPYSSNGIYMEILAVKAPDGSIRTAFNTCQVCYNSGRGYFVQQGDAVVCQNCGNRFRLEQIEKVKGGCNPVPITKEDKVQTANTITIPAKFISKYQPLFIKWKKK